MKKEEILAKSRAENKNRDIYEQEVLKQGWEIAVAVMAILATVFSAVQIFVSDGVDGGIWAIMFSCPMATFWVKWFKLRRRHELIFALFYTAVVVTLSVQHIYNLIAASAIL